MISKSFSKAKIARILGVNRGTIYDWEAHGFPVDPPERPGRGARVDFEAALTWFLDREADRGVSPEGLRILERAIRERKKDVLTAANRELVTDECNEGLKNSTRSRRNSTEPSKP